MSQHLAQGQLAETLEFSAVTAVTLSLWVSGITPGILELWKILACLLRGRGPDRSHVWVRGLSMSSCLQPGPSGTRTGTWTHHNALPRIVSREFFMGQSRIRAQKHMWVPLGGAEILVGLKQRVPVGDGGPANQSLLGLVCSVCPLCCRPQGDSGDF